MQTPSTASHDQVYEPCEDSFLFLDVLEQEKFGATTVLEIGSGSGVVSTFLRKLHPQAVYMASDVNLNACKTTQQTWELSFADQIETLHASLSPLRPHSVDLLLFNPPYVPSENVPQLPEDEQSDQWIYLALDGGEDGMQVTNLVLADLDTILSSEGVAYILFCARNKPKEVKAQMEAKGWLVHECLTRKAGWEVLTILRFQRGS